MALYLNVRKLMVKLQNQQANHYRKQRMDEAISFVGTLKNIRPGCAESHHIFLPARAITPRMENQRAALTYGLLAIILCFLSLSAFAQQETFTLHTVVKGETLYSVCKRYTVPMTEVIELNNMGENGYSLAVGQILKIPAAATVSLQSLREARISDDGYITHVVKQGETLYSICRSYNGITVPMLREKNNLKSDTLKINQKLIIPQAINVKSAYKDVKKASSAQNIPLEKQFIAAEATAGSVDITRGIATWIDTPDEENMKNFYALHKTAPIGSVIKVRNLMNNRTTCVKVVGKLPDNEAYRSITIKVSGGAAYALHALDSKFIVEMSMPQF